ncbi:hypothetical protein GPECTOR_17g916 [Gonium pectorale]|uniref:asparagine synthase (glutamine-hydrolyzing) n=1 Tax=Gonium pectorale TaxID=33097 RepID=A0A150GKG2_GONPE|nr:hypothetical protein GPECTOR_17g916 [Gonium pectorale]|eukprot:KXZ50277.1 hypothetical protein GPECTOR_17g916 [Gonium pectorale]
MCGILAVLNAIGDSKTVRQRVVELSRRQRHRGPDWSRVECAEAAVQPPAGYGQAHHFLAHERLAIMDPAAGDQPLYNGDGSVVATVNGEIYNHQALRAKILAQRPGIKFASHSDCEVVPYLYEVYGERLASMLDGFFAVALLDARSGALYAARDPLGVTSLYIGWGRDGSVWLSSELKCLQDECTRFQHFPPGHYYSSATGAFVRYYNPPFYTDFEAVPRRFPSAPFDAAALRQAFEAAVSKRLMSDVPYGVLLSGGLDSSLVAAVASRQMRARSGNGSGGGGGQGGGNGLLSFCIGLTGSPDLQAARRVASFLGTRHHEFTFTLQEGLDALGDVIHHIETFDVTTVRASTPMFLMARKIKALGVKMVLSGEGADEVFGGYLYFHKAPNKEEFHSETVRKLRELFRFDCLRANKATMAWGVEARVPFLDRAFLEVAMGVDPAEKMIDTNSGRIEKYILRKAFDTPEDPYLPAEVLWRQKEQFSDGVGYGWIDGLKARAEQLVSDRTLADAEHRYPDNPPRTKEAYWYRTVFESHFPHQAAADTVPGGPSVACSTPAAAAWDAAWAGREDPSGRAVAGVHEAAKAEAEAEAGTTAARDASSIDRDSSQELAATATTAATTPPSPPHVSLSALLAEAADGDAPLALGRFPPGAAAEPAIGGGGGGCEKPPPLAELESLSPAAGASALALSGETDVGKARGAAEVSGVPTPQPAAKRLRR